MVDNVFGTRSGNTAIFPQSDGNQAFIDWEALFSKDGQIPALAKQARLPQSDNAKSTANSGLQDLTTADAKPCATCDTNQAYSLAFQVMDGSPNKCRPCAGMYYTVYFKLGSYPAAQGQTDENGLTARYFCSNPAEEIYLYIGHREKEDGYPTSRDTDEHKYDEAPLWNARVALVAEKKVIEAKTQRLWKPWTVSETEKNFLKDKVEEFAKHYYDLGDGGLTIGYGDFTPYKLRNGKPNPEIEQLKKDYPAEGPGISEQDALKKFESNLEKKAHASSWNSDNGKNSVNVPLYQHEFDALVNMRYNNSNTPYATKGADLKTHEVFSGRTSVQAYLNRGQYNLAAERIPTSFNTVKGAYSKGVTNRRLAEKKMFTKGVYEKW